MPGVGERAPPFARPQAPRRDWPRPAGGKEQSTHPHFLLARAFLTPTFPAAFPWFLLLSLFFYFLFSSVFVREGSFLKFHFFFFFK